MNIGSDLTAAQFAKPVAVKQNLYSVSQRDPFLNIYNESTPVGKLVKEKYMEKVSKKLKNVNVSHRNSLKRIANVKEGSIYNFVKEITDSIYNMALTDDTALNKILKTKISALVETGATQFRTNTGTKTGEELAITKKLLESSIGSKAAPGLLKTALDSFAASISYALVMRKEAPSLDEALCSKLDNYTPERFRTLMINVCLKLITFFALVNTLVRQANTSQESRLSPLRSVFQFIVWGSVDNTPMPSIRATAFRPKLEETIGKEQLVLLEELGPVLSKKLQALIIQIKTLQKIYGEPVIPTELEKESADAIARIERLSQMSDTDRANEELLENMGEVSDILIDVTKAISQLGITYFVFTNGAIIAFAKILFSGSIASGLDFAISSHLTSPFIVNPLASKLSFSGGRRHTKKQKHGKKQKRRHTKKH